MTEQYDKENHWYGWNGGECPVHPETVVTILFSDGSKQVAQRSGDVFGWTAGNIAAFTILKLYREPRKPREWWIALDTESLVLLPRAYASEAEAQIQTDDGGQYEIVHVREVLPEGDA